VTCLFIDRIINLTQLCNGRTANSCTCWRNTKTEMKYEGMVIRPPSEAGSLLLQVTVGCSHNKCTFCPTYKGERFRIKTFDEIEEDILEASGYGYIDRIFLCDGDVLIMPMRKLAPVLESINSNIKGVNRIGLYANAKSILRKTPEELLELRNLGVKNSLSWCGDRKRRDPRNNPKGGKCSTVWWKRDRR